MKSNRGKRGQFVIIAVMLTAIMIVSIGAIMHEAVTYYRHEPWEEYSAIVGDIEINSRKTVELSLASYTKNLANNPTAIVQDKSILNNTLKEWENDLTKIYPNNGIVLTHSLIGAGIENPAWNTSTSTSKASAKFKLDIRSIGLEGYDFTIVTSLSLKVYSSTNVTSTTNEILVIVTSETGLPVSDLNEGNFKIENATSVSVSPNFEILGYTILYTGPLHPHVEVRDQRGIYVIGLA